MATPPGLLPSSLTWIYAQENGFRLLVKGSESAGAVRPTDPNLAQHCFGSVDRRRRVRRLVRVDPNHYRCHLCLPRLLGYEATGRVCLISDVSSSDLFRATPRSDPTGRHLVRKPEQSLGRRFVNPAHRINRRYDHVAASPWIINQTGRASPRPSAPGDSAHRTRAPSDHPGGRRGGARITTPADRSTGSDRQRGTGGRMAGRSAGQPAPEVPFCALAGERRPSFWRAVLCSRDHGYSLDGQCCSHGRRRSGTKQRDGNR